MSNKAVVDGKRFGSGLLVGTVLAAVGASGLLVSNLAAQQPRVRVNQIIEQFEQGRPAFADEHWQFLSLTLSPFLLDDLEAALADLRVEGSRPRLTPIVRIPYWGEQQYQHVIKQLLSVGAMGITLPEVETKEQAARLVETMRYPPPAWREVSGAGRKARLLSGRGAALLGAFAERVLSAIRRLALEPGRRAPGAGDDRVADRHREHRRDPGGARAWRRADWSG